MKNITLAFLFVLSLCLLNHACAYPPNYSLSKYNRKYMTYEVSNSKLIIPGSSGDGDESPTDEPTEDAIGN